MVRRPTRSTRTDTLLPYTTLFRCRTRRIHRILPPVLAPEPSTFTMAQMSRARTIRPKIPPISRSMIHLPRVADTSREQRLRQDHVPVVVLASQVAVETRPAG